MEIFIHLKNCFALSKDGVDGMDDAVRGFDVGLNDGGNGLGTRWGVIGEGHLKDGSCSSDKNALQCNVSLAIILPLLKCCRKLLLTYNILVRKG